MQGGLDGGLDIPHSEKRFVGYDREKKELDSDTLRKYIYGGHVGEYIEELKEEDLDLYKKQFSKYDAEDVDPEELEDLYKGVRDGNLHLDTRS